MTIRSFVGVMGISCVVAVTACGSSSNPSATSQTPPMGGAAVEAWLAAGSYKQWTCEPQSHAARSPSPHGFNRICSNSVVSSNAVGTAAWPEGASAVKELLADATSTTPVGYAVYLKTNTDSAAGSNWYWYERIPVDSTAFPHDANGVVADGTGGTGPAMTICVSCHAAAGSDAAHTPSPGGRDEVYTAVH
jgi:hypothetical protein